MRSSGRQTGSRRLLLWFVWVAVALNLIQFPIIELGTSRYHRAVSRFTDPDLAFITDVQTRSVQTRFGFYLNLAEIDGQVELAIFRGIGLAGEQLYGLGEVQQVTVEDYDPQLPPSVADELSMRARFTGELPDDRRYVIVAEEDEDTAVRRMRAFQHGSTLFVVDQSEMPAVTP